MSDKEQTQDAAPAPAPAPRPGGFSGPRQLHDVSAMGLKCEECKVDITELPFEPKNDRPVYCRDCNSKRRKNFAPRRY